jgi:hypothetical protein
MQRLPANDHSMWGSAMRCLVGQDAMRCLVGQDAILRRVADPPSLWVAAADPQ